MGVLREPAFICDEMLKKLSRWLRIAGYDVLSPDVDTDEEIVALAMRTGRIVLTRDKDLSNRRGIEALRIVSDELKEQLEEFLLQFPRESFAPGPTRCPLCNGSLRRYKKGKGPNPEMEIDIPSKVKEEMDFFYVCSSCRKIYWEGTHWRRIETLLGPMGMMPELP
ncbi:MAG: Mut7-C RNAse domain-containing protein [Thermoplasmatota archaeon]